MITGLVLANCFLGLERQVEESIRKIQGVSEIYRTYGVYDLVIKVFAEDENKLREVVRMVKAANGVQSVLTNIIYRAEAGLASATAGAA